MEPGTGIAVLLLIIPVAAFVVFIWAMAPFETHAAYEKRLELERKAENDRINKPPEIIWEEPGKA